MEANANWMSGNGLVTLSEVAATITRFPNMLSYSVLDKLQPTLVYLQEELGLSPSDVKRILIEVPDLFGRRVDTLKTNVESMNRIGLQEDHLKR